MNIRKIKNDEFDKVFEVLKESFPTDEYRTYEEQKDLLGNPLYTIYVLPDSQDKDIMAFIAVWQFNDFAYVEHFAVSQEYRNRHLGSKIISEIVKMLPCPVCLEVELPTTDNAKRRIGFYKRNGFFFNNYTYVQPPFSKDKNPIPLAIMTSGRSIVKEEFEKIKTVLYREVYKC
ncbi:MAG: GNAT family N-acetyltransferase [Ruminococcus sp.]